MPTLFVVVKELPRNARVEKQVLYHTSRCLVEDEDEDLPILQNCRRVFDRGNIIAMDVHFELNDYE